MRIGHPITIVVVAATHFFCAFASYATPERSSYGVWKTSSLIEKNTGADCTIGLWVSEPWSPGVDSWLGVTCVIWLIEHFP